MYRCARESNYAFTFAKADNPYDMIKMSVEIKKSFVHVAYHNEVKGIHGLSHLIDKHGGKVPQSFEF
jgi:endonuclease-3